MLAAVLQDFDKLVLEDVPTPEPGMQEVVVRIKACEFCATDYKAIRGIRRNVTFPFIAGHEPAGIVAKVGMGVSNVKEGDEVICQPSGYCGLCMHCRAGNTHYCEHAFTTGGDGPADVRPGAFAEYMKTDARCLLPKPASLSFDAAALTEPLSGAWKGIIQYSEMKVGDDVVILGVAGGTPRRRGPERLRAGARFAPGSDGGPRPDRGAGPGENLRDHAAGAGPDSRGGRADRSGSPHGEPAPARDPLEHLRHHDPRDLRT